MKNFVNALKTNADVRKKTLIVTGITVAAVAAGVVLVKLNADQKNVILVLEDARLRRSVEDHVRPLDYEVDPGLSATALVRFDVEHCVERLLHRRANHLAQVLLDLPFVDLDDVAQVLLCCGRCTVLHH